MFPIQRYASDCLHIQDKLDGRFKSEIEADKRHSVLGHVYIWSFETQVVAAGTPLHSTSDDQFRQSLKPLKSPMYPSAPAASSPGKTGSSSVVMTSSCDFTLQYGVPPRRLRNSKLILTIYAP